MNYSLSSARASLPFSELIRIKIPKLNDKDIKEVKNLEKGLIKQLQESSDNFEKINRIVSKLL
ncbi:MAG: hypothetical protein LN563_02325 [Rickettsia endosymbiont of Platyusa sonomae]|nr:hypothetical protein [Rickettsia endosymbiont of Platyusa sonomae]